MSFDPAETNFSLSATPELPSVTNVTQTFYYFAYGSCMCPVDLTRTIGEDATAMVLGTSILPDYRLAFNRKSPKRQSCGVLDIVPHKGSHVEGVLYQLPWSVSDKLDIREEVPSNGYRQEQIAVQHQGQQFEAVRTYVVVEKTLEEVPPDDWYFYVVMRGAMTSGLSRDYSWRLFNHMKRLQRGQSL
ncbi:MAG: gamma-glutamylcyclotransferase [Limnothrix sp.]